MRIPGLSLLLSLSKLEASLILLALLSLALLLFPDSKITFERVLNPLDFPAHLFSDQKGVAQVSWVNENQQEWRCYSEKRFGSAYCSYVLTLKNAKYQGLDLSRYSRIALTANYKGNGKSLRIYLRNRHPDYYDEKNEISTKYNLVEIPVSFLLEGRMFDMSHFVVADWWLDSRKLALEQSKPEFGDVIFLEIQSGTFREAGSDQLQLKSIRFEGDYINDELLFRMLAIVWVFVIFGFLVIRLVQLHHKAKISEQHQQELRAIHKTLNLKNKQFEDLAKKDPLTGALNRVGIRDHFREALLAWQERHSPLSLIFLDIDHFKSINDTFGHDVGDVALTSVAEYLQSQLPENCALARWGGEEFVIACRGKSLLKTEALAETLCSGLANSRFAGELHITASFGVASLDEHGLSHLIKKADEAVYQAKMKGRNQVVCEELSEKTT